MTQLSILRQEKEDYDGTTASPEEAVFSLEIPDTYTQEIILGLCGPVGSPINNVADIIESVLDDVFHYETEIIKLSDFISEYSQHSPPQSEFHRISQLISDGDRLRKTHGNSVLASLAISRIHEQRKAIKEKSNDARFAARRKCFIVNSIKNQAELDLFKQVYRDLFYAIGVFSPIDVRRRNLERKGMSQSNVHELIDRDSGIESKHIKYGQTVEETFPASDFFVRIDSTNDAQIRTNIERLFHLIFNTKIITPTIDETSMYFAFSAAANSACLSRQVGACIVSDDGDVLSVGWNDVPSFGGGLYRTRTPFDNLAKDHRCMNKEGGTCFNDKEKALIAEQIARALLKEKLIASDKLEEAVKTISNSKIKHLIEFSRAVHAEMYAIIQASKEHGRKVEGSTLYCTTFPCHSCARHILAAGIKQVFFIEPYPKSLAIKLHDDDISQSTNSDSKLSILAFDGVAPSRYQEFFRFGQNSRKEKIKDKPTRKQAGPKIQLSLESMPVLEGIAIKKIEGLIRK